MVDRSHGSMSPLVCSEINSQIDLFNSLLYDEINKEPLINLLDLVILFYVGLYSCIGDLRGSFFIQHHSGTANKFKKGERLTLII